MLRVVLYSKQTWRTVQQLPSSPAPNRLISGNDRLLPPYATTAPAARVVEEGRVVDMDQWAWGNGRAQFGGMNWALGGWTASQYVRRWIITTGDASSTALGAVLVSAPPRLIAFTSGALSSAPNRRSPSGGGPSMCTLLNNR
ncbi:unnamed protein product [Boreogadus saida]